MNRDEPSESLRSSGAFEFRAGCVYSVGEVSFQLLHTKERAIDGGAQGDSLSLSAFYGPSTNPSGAALGEIPRRALIERRRGRHCRDVPVVPAVKRAT